MTEEIPAYSEKTDTQYPNFSALVDAEANGWMVCVVLQRGAAVWPWMIGPFTSKRRALREQRRQRGRFKRQQANRDLPENLTAKFFVRPAWKEEDW